MDATDALEKENKRLKAAMLIAASVLMTAQDIQFTHAQKNGVLLVMAEWLKKQQNTILYDLYGVGDIPF